MARHAISLILKENAAGMRMHDQSLGKNIGVRRLGVVSVLSHVEEFGTVAPNHVYLSLLKECIKARDIVYAKEIYAHLLRHQIELTRSLGDQLVLALARSGALDDAQQVLISLPCRSVLAWTALISGYVDGGHACKALEIHHDMQKDCVQPNQYTFVILFKACAIMRNLEEVERIRALAEKHGLMSDVFVASTLVSAYSKCRNILAAENVFNGLCSRNHVSWNAMLSAYVEQGLGDEALLLYRQMQAEGVILNQRTVVVTLQACVAIIEKEEAIGFETLKVKVKLLEIGRALHADAQKNNAISDVFVCTALVCMYSKCGSILEAENVFDAFSQRNIVSWNAMMSAYVEQDQLGKALLLYKQIQREGVSIHTSTLVITLQACTSFLEKNSSDLHACAILEIGSALHRDALKKGFISDVSLGSILVSLYGSCGNVPEAERVFTGLSQRSAVSWGLMVAVFNQNNQPGKALQLYRQMQEDGVCPIEQTFVTTLQACTALAEEEEAFYEDGCPFKAACLEIGRALHVDAKKRGFTLSMPVGSSIAGMYGKCGSIVEAEHMFDSLSQCNIVSWSVMLSVYVEHCQGEKALQLYAQMQVEGISSDKQAYVTALQACGVLAGKEEVVVEPGQSLKVVSLKIGEALHDDARRQDLTSDIFIGNTLVYMYGKCGNIAKAKYAFDEILQHDTISWNAMLLAYAEQGQQEKSLHLYCQMQEEGVSMDDLTVLCALQACHETGSLEICKQVHFHIISLGLDFHPLLASALIRAYGSSASMIDAQAVVDGFSEGDSVLWNACLAGYAQEGDSAASLRAFEEILKAGLSPDGVTFLSFLSACSQDGLINDGLHFFQLMVQDYCIMPDTRHYVTMVDLLGRAGDFRKVEDFVFGMPTEAGPAVWMCLLNVCRTLCNLEVGRQTFECVVALVPKNASAYVLMSNIYADFGLKECANEAGRFRQNTNAWSGTWYKHMQQERSPRAEYATL